MPSYYYKAADAAGRLIEGRISAADRVQAVAALREKNITLIDVREEKGGSLSTTSLLSSLKPRHLPQADLVFIARQMDNLLQAGSELDRSLNILATLITRKKVSDLVREIELQIRRGKSLADALQATDGLFPAFFISMIRAGESAGALGVAFRRLAEILERQQQARSRLVSALIYPAILLTATIGSVVLIMTVVVPQFQPIFEQARQELPFLTRLVIGLSHVTVDLLPIFGPLVAAAMIGLSLWLRQPMAKLRWHTGLLKVPLLGGAILKAETAKLAYILGALLQGGVPLVNALDIAQGSLSNTRLREALKACRELVKNGVKISAALSRQSVFPSMLVQLTAIAEESARLGDTLLDIGRIYDNETETTIQRMVSLATPLATVFLGGMVATVLAAILLAVLKINDLAF